MALRILIVGPRGSGHKSAVENITGEKHDIEDWEGYVTQTTFKSKYFETDIGIWTDEYTNIDNWISEFSSDEAAEVREALTIFIYLFDEVDEKIAQFLKKLSSETTSLAIPSSFSGDEFSPEQEKILDLGFSEVIDKASLHSVCGGIIYDAVQQETTEESGETDLEIKEPRDLDSILEELRAARNSETMTDSEKMVLAEELARELLE